MFDQQIVRGEFGFGGKSQYFRDNGKCIEKRDGVIGY